MLVEQALVELSGGASDLELVTAPTALPGAEVRKGVDLAELRWIRTMVALRAEPGRVVLRFPDEEPWILSSAAAREWGLAMLRSAERSARLANEASQDVGTAVRSEVPADG